MTRRPAPGTIDLHEREVRDWLVIAVSGELDIATTPRLASTLRERFRRRSRRFCLDLTDVGFLDSTGLGALLEARRAADRVGAELAVVAGPGTPVRRALEVAGVRRVLAVVDDVAHVTAARVAPAPAVGDTGRMGEREQAPAGPRRAPERKPEPPARPPRATAIGNRATARAIARMESKPAVEALAAALAPGVLGADQTAVDAVTAFRHDPAGADEVAKGYEQQASEPLLPPLARVPRAAAELPEGRSGS